MNTIDKNIYALNLDYLVLAHELIFAGQPQQAMTRLGLSPDAVSLLANMRIDQLTLIAESDILTFAPRFHASYWSNFLNNDFLGTDMNEQRARRLHSIICNAGR
jgi:hypothetical protein